MDIYRQLNQNPFRRLVVYNSVDGTTYIHWELAPWFEVPGPYTYTLQTARTPNPDDTDWTQVGESLVDPPFFTDSTTPTYGMINDKNYRLILSTSEGEWVSPPGHCHGQLRPREWKIAKEIYRKERLNAKYTAVPVTLLKKRNSGPKCSFCTSEDLGAPTNSACEHCYGTGYAGGYHTPVTMQMMTISPSQLREMKHTNDATTFNIAIDKYQARANGLPEINADDIIVDLSTDQRFRVIASPVIAQMHRVPLVRQVEMELLAASDIAYTIPIDAETSDKAEPARDVGCGDVLVNSSYNDSELLYLDDNNNPVIGATVTIYEISEGEETLIGVTKTTTGGKWLDDFYLENDTYYRVVFEKPGFYGPDTTTITTPEKEKDPDEAASPDPSDYDFLTAF